MENVHSETYSLLIDTLIKDPKERYGNPYSYIIMIYCTVWFLTLAAKVQYLELPVIVMMFRLLLAVYHSVADHALT